MRALPIPIPVLLLPICITTNDCVGIKKPFEKSVQDAALHAHLMSYGIINALLGALLYFWLTRSDFSYAIKNALISMSTSLGIFLITGVFLNHVIAEQPLTNRFQWAYEKDYLSDAIFYKMRWTIENSKKLYRCTVATIRSTWRKVFDKLNDMHIEYSIGSKFNGYFISLKTPLINHLQYSQSLPRLKRGFACVLIDDT